jgi:hypothetical protein
MHWAGMINEGYKMDVRPCPNVHADKKSDNIYGD